MMEYTRLYEILEETTTLVARRGNGFQPTAPDGFEIIDCILVAVGVRKDPAEAHKAELIELLKAYPQPERLAAGPSYIEVGGVLGDQGAAFQLFALGQVLGLWKIISPTTVGIRGEDAHRMAGNGFVLMSGYDCRVAT